MCSPALCALLHAARVQLGKEKVWPRLCERIEIIRPHLYSPVNRSGKWKYSSCAASEKAIS